MRVYLAHPMGTYGSVCESQAIALLESAGHEVINPRERQYGKACGKHMTRWARLASACEAIALLPFTDGKMGSGMKIELEAAVRAGRIILHIAPAANSFAVLSAPPDARFFLDIVATARRNRGAQALREKSGVPFVCDDTVLRPEWVASALGRGKPVVTPVVLEVPSQPPPARRFRAVK
jgi:hypothetical protein